MRKAQGYAVMTDPSLPMAKESDTFTCAHCNSIVFVRAFQDAAEMGGFCRMCMRHICSQAECHAHCEPFEKKLEAMERRDRLLRACR